MESKLTINKCLSSEHRELSALLGSFRNFLRDNGIKQQPMWRLPLSTKLLSDLRSAFGFNVPKHFALEENELFPILEEAGCGQLVEILLEDHKLIMEIIQIVMPLLDKAQSTGLLSEDEWQTLLRQGDALVTELAAHAEKEDASMVPELEEILDKAQADEIYHRYRSLSM
jgi:hemerythrin-like domain-containing protein